MNRMKKLLALLLVLALGLSLAACGGAKSDIVGTWRGKVDMTEYIISKGDADIGAVLSDQGVDMPLDSIGNYLTEFAPVCTYVFREDGTYTFTMDEASMQLVLEAYQAGVEAYFRYSGNSRYIYLDVDNTPVELYGHQLQQLEQDGTALTQMESAMSGTYNWPDDPWPWDYEQED